jgi:hypothetical protein
VPGHLSLGRKGSRRKTLPLTVITPDSVLDEGRNCDGCNADLNSVVFSSHFTPAGGKVLFKREHTGRALVYEIQDGGQSRMVNIKAPEGYDVSELIPTDGNWLLRFNKPDAKGNRPNGFASFLEVDPQNGKALREYRLKLPYTMPETVISCYFDGEFWGVRHNAKEGNIKVVRGTAQLYRGK